MKKAVTIIGAGLAGCEAALWLSENGFQVTIYDAKPNKLAAYKFNTFAELVCNNSLGGRTKTTPLGLLLHELNLCGSKLVKIARECQVIDPSFVAVDKEAFSKKVTSALFKNEVVVKSALIEKLPDTENLIIATGPLTSERLIEDISLRYGIKAYHFSDASSSIVDITSIDLNNKHIHKISDDLYVVEIQKEVFKNFHVSLLNSKNSLSCVDRDINFDKCQTIENLAKQGIETLIQTRFHYETYSSPCLLLRRERAMRNGFIMVGCMTTLRHQQQKKIFSKLPGFSNCHIIKYGRMHRNTFFNSPQFLNNFYQINYTNTFVVGQISGIDGYAPAISSGMVAALKMICGDAFKPFSEKTMIGGLANYVSNPNVVDFQPMCASFSLLDESDDATTLSNLKKYIESLNLK